MQWPKKNNLVVSLLFFSSVSFCSLSLADTPSQPGEVTQKVKKLSREYMSTLKTNAHKTYERLKAKNQQMVHERATQTSAIPEAIMQEKTSSKIAHKTLPRSAPIKTKVSTHKQIRKAALLPKSANPTPVVNQQTKTHAIFHYIPTIDFAQYALHQGDVRSANLIEGFIPLYQSTLSTLSFADIRFYNPNGTPIEGNIDLGFRRLFHQNSRLFGLYAGYDRYRSQTRRYYSQANAGVEFWFHRFFLGGNAYIPLGTKVYDNDAVNLAYLVPTDVAPYRYNISYAQGKERAMSGGDVEVGLDVTKGLTLYAGGYYFDHSNAKRITGPKFRATYTFYRSYAHRLFYLFDRIRLEGLVSHDSVRGTSWMAGFRFRFGLSKQTNSSIGLARHMTDPIRRDLNVVTQNFNKSPFIYKVNTQEIRVDLVDNGLTRTINEAVTDGPDADAEVIGVIGNQTTLSSIELGGRSLTITGGDFDFDVDGHPYSVNSLGKNGEITLLSNFLTPIFNVVDPTGDKNLTIKNLKLFGDTVSVESALQTDGNSFGKITVDHVQAQAPFIFELTTSNTTGEVQFTNNKIQVGRKGELLWVSCVEFRAGSMTKLHVTQFSGNTLNVMVLEAPGLDAYNVYSYSVDGTDLIYDNGVVNNVFTITQYFGVTTNASTFLADGVIIYGGITGNQVNLYRNYFSDVTTGFSFSDTTVVGDVSKNIFNAENNNGTSLGGIAVVGDGITTINGNITENIFHLSNNPTSDVAGIESLSGAFIVTGNFSGNSFTISNNGVINYGVYLISTSEFSGPVKNNTFTIDDENDVLNAGFKFDLSTTEKVTFSSAVSNNRVDITTPNTDSYGFYLEAAGSDTDYGIHFETYDDEGALTSANSNATFNDFSSQNVIFGN